MASHDDPHGEHLYDSVQAAAAHIRGALAGRRPVLGLILGSGLGAFAERLTAAVAIEYGEIPGFAPSTVAGHGGRLVIGQVAPPAVERAERRAGADAGAGAGPGEARAGGAAVCCVAMQGRLHLYEGHSARMATFPARVMIALGARVLIITNAAGGVHAEWEPGTLMLIRDHLNLMPDHPLRGPNDERLGPRFPDMTRAYDPTLRSRARRVAERLGVDMREGVYAGLGGPSYETPAEIRMLRQLGADAVGMSTVPEVIVARHMGARVLGISCITNKAAGITGEVLSHDEVTDTAARVRDQLESLLRGIILDVGSELPAERGGERGSEETR